MEKKKKKEKTVDIFYLTLPAKPRFVSVLIDFIQSLFRKLGIKKHLLEDIIISVDEVFTNIVMHAYRDIDNKYVDVRIDLTKNGIYFTISDCGEKWNFKSIPDPDIPLKIAGKQKGGYGIYIIKRLMDRVDFKREKEKNQVVLFKKLDS